ncbi:phage tail protein [Thioclava sp. UBA3469]|uniref:phage tail protein n=1 Tax=Thioclava sp. UBA3469 TaxID=1947693 RepID=UPI000C693587|nr:tail fiber protein [Thioclava sp. UBA3469]MAQ38435.1 phage tail protein [Thioclava sp.]|tara:strand:- start:46 stop:558 length:513 start_codon:yes stop_codon:yes gene_type:complete
MEPFLGMIMPVAFDFAPQGWALCNGQLMSIAQYSALFSLLGTEFGGDGRTTFGLPDLRGRSPRGAAMQTRGQKLGSEAVTLTDATMPSHSHPFVASQLAIAGRAPIAPDDMVIASGNIPAGNLYGSAEAPVALAQTNIGHTGGGIAHPNMQPSLCVNYVIALQGIFPQRS